jgi:hypothetical protein
MRCTLPRLQAPNVQVHSELALENCTVTGPIVLLDARIEGPLRLIGTSLHTPAVTRWSGCAWRFAAC